MSSPGGAVALALLARAPRHRGHRRERDRRRQQDRSTRVSVAAAARPDTAGIRTLPEAVPASTRASPRNGAASRRRGPVTRLAPSRYTATSCAPTPATVSASNSASDSTLAAGAPPPPRGPAGAVQRQRWPAGRTRTAAARSARSRPAWPTGAAEPGAHGRAGAEPRQPARPRRAARARAQRQRRPEPPAESMLPLSLAGQHGRIAPRRWSRRPPREGRGRPGVPPAVTAKIAPPRDDRGRPGSLAFRTWKQPSKSTACASGSGRPWPWTACRSPSQPGQVTGFVGPNGAGKSTTMRVILGLDAADEGTRADRRPAVPEPAPPAAATSARCWTPARCSRAGPRRNHLLWLAHSQGLTARRVDEVIEQAGLEAGGPAARRAATRSACGSGSGSPPRCSATRRC